MKIIPYGKFRGWKFSSIYEDFRSYYNWAINNKVQCFIEFELVRKRNLLLKIKKSKFYDSASITNSLSDYAGMDAHDSEGCAGCAHEYIVSMACDEY